jgi:hypothetical protein
VRTAARGNGEDGGAGEWRGGRRRRPERETAAWGTGEDGGAGYRRERRTGEGGGGIDLRADSEMAVDRRGRRRADVEDWSELEERRGGGEGTRSM